MTGRDVDQLLRSWFAEGLDELPDRELDAAMARVSVTAQDRRRRWAIAPPMRISPVAAAVILVAALLVSAGVALVGSHLTRPAPERDERFVHPILAGDRIQSDLIGLWHGSGFSVQFAPAGSATCRDIVFTDQDCLMIGQGVSWDLPADVMRGRALAGVAVQRDGGIFWQHTAGADVTWDGLGQPTSTCLERGELERFTTWVSRDNLQLSWVGHCLMGGGGANLLTRARPAP